MTKLPTMKPNREERRKGMTDADKILVNIKKLSLQDGDVVAFSFRGQPSKEFTSSVAQALQNVGKKLTVLFLPYGVGIDRLNEQQMDSLGWVRKRKHAGLILPGHLEAQPTQPPVEQPG